MSQPPIEKLTPFQEALIPIYCEKWIAYTLSTEPINRQKAAVAVKAAYKIIGECEYYLKNLKIYTRIDSLYLARMAPPD